MTHKEESSFLQEVESRLDSLFGEDTAPTKEKDRVPPLPTAEEVAADIREEETRESSTLKITAREAEDSSEPIQTQVQDKSTFVSEIEKRFTAIFGDDDKNVRAINETEKPDDAGMMIQAGREESKSIGEPLEEISLSPSSVLLSPLKDLKGIVLSLEWEINDQILEQWEGEVNKLYLLYTGDRIIQGLLRILRFAGRYVRVRGASSNQDSIELLMSVYDQLENIMVSEGMTEAKKQILLMESIKKYRSWVENTDLEDRVETQAAGINMDAVQPPDLEPPEIKFPEESKEEVISFADVRIAEEKPLAEAEVAEISLDAVKLPEAELDEVKFPEESKEEVISFADVQIAEEKPSIGAAIDQSIGEEPALREMTRESAGEFMIQEPDTPAPPGRSPLDEMFMPAPGEDVQRMIAAMRDRPPEEAFAYALTELKKTFQAEIDTLKEEIRLLKNAG